MYLSWTMSATYPQRNRTWSSKIPKCSPANTWALLMLYFPPPRLPITSSPLPSLFESFAQWNFHFGTETVAGCCKYALISTTTPPIKRPTACGPWERQCNDALPTTADAVTDAKISGNWHQWAEFLILLQPGHLLGGGSPSWPVKGGAKWAPGFWPKTVQRVFECCWGIVWQGSQGKLYIFLHQGGTILAETESLGGAKVVSFRLKQCSGGCRAAALAFLRKHTNKLVSWCIEFAQRLSMNKIRRPNVLEDARVGVTFNPETEDEDISSRNLGWAKNFPKTWWGGWGEGANWCHISLWNRVASQ